MVKSYFFKIWILLQLLILPCIVLPGGASMCHGEKSLKGQSFPKQNPESEDLELLVASWVSEYGPPPGKPPTVPGFRAQRNALCRYSQASSHPSNLTNLSLLYPKNTNQIPTIQSYSSKPNKTDLNQMQVTQTENTINTLNKIISQPSIQDSRNEEPPIEEPPPTMIVPTQKTNSTLNLFVSQQSESQNNMSQDDKSFNNNQNIQILIILSISGATLITIVITIIALLLCKKHFTKSIQFQLESMQTDLNHKISVIIQQNNGIFEKKKLYFRFFCFETM